MTNPIPPAARPARSSIKVFRIPFNEGAEHVQKLLDNWIAENPARAIHTVSSGCPKNDSYLIYVIYSE